MNLIFSVSSGKGKFVNEGFCRWDKATDRLGSHERTKEHVGNNGRWEQSLFYSNQNTAINNQLAPKRRDVMEDHREYFRILVTNIRYFCLQGLPYRHESEHDEEAVNKGNWAELHETILNNNAEFQRLRQEVVKAYSNQVDYASKVIFNEFVEVMAGEVRDMIGHEIKEAGMFFLMFDESKYSADHEQISVCVR